MRIYVDTRFCSYAAIEERFIDEVKIVFLPFRLNNSTGVSVLELRLCCSIAIIILLMGSLLCFGSVLSEMSMT